MTKSSEPAPHPSDTASPKKAPPADIASRVKHRARVEGFTDVGVCRIGQMPDVARNLRAFVDQGRHGQMDWLERRLDWRGNPAALWPEARSAIVLADSYTPGHDPLESLAHPGKGTISVYAQNRDYHDVVKKRLKRLGRWMLERHGGQIKVFVDTAPVPEKPLGQKAGLGWQGKHTNLLGRTWGNWAFLGVIYTTLHLSPDRPERDHCGSCRACLDVCPTDAFPAPYQLDARRCVSYLTIEHKGPVDPALRPKLGNRIYGCDDCLAVCPWNKFAVAASDAKYVARPDLVSPDLKDLAGLDDTTFRARFSGSPIKRIGRDRFVRNVLYAIGNSGRASLKAAAAARVNDPDPVVAEAARWACRRLDRA